MEQKIFKMMSFTLASVRDEESAKKAQETLTDE